MSAGGDPGPACYGQRRHAADGHRRGPGAGLRSGRLLPGRRDRARRGRRTRPPSHRSPSRWAWTVERGRRSDLHDRQLVHGRPDHRGRHAARPRRARLHTGRGRRRRTGPCRLHRRPAAHAPGGHPARSPPPTRRSACSPWTSGATTPARTSPVATGSTSSACGGLYADMEAEATAGFGDAGRRRRRIITFSRTADLRTSGQFHEVEVERPGGHHRRPRAIEARDSTTSTRGTRQLYTFDMPWQGSRAADLPAAGDDPQGSRSSCAGIAAGSTGREPARSKRRAHVLVRRDRSGHAGL